MDLGTLKVRITADTADLTKGIASAQSRVQAMSGRMKSLGSGMTSVGKSMSLAVTAPIALMAKMGIDELGQIQKANQQTSASIRRIGAGSLVSVAGVQKLARELQKKSGIDDQVIQSSQNMLLTLGALDTRTREGAKAFDMASRAAVDYAEATGTDAASAGKLFAKSLAAASEGTLQLPRGIKLGEQAMAKLRAEFDAAGSASERQAVLAEALGEKFKGAAQLTAADKWANLKDQLAGVSASIVEQLLPAFTKVVTKVSGWISKFDEMSPATKKVIGVVALLAAAAGPLLIIVGSLVSAVGSLLPVLAALSGPVGLIIAGCIALGVALVVLWRENEAFRDGVLGVWNSVRAGVEGVLNSLRATIEVWTGWAQAIWKSYGEQIGKIVAFAWNAVRTIIGSQLSMIKNVVQAALALLRGDFSGAWEHIKAAVKAAFTGIKTIIETQIAVVKAAVGLVWSAIEKGVPAAWGAIKAAVVSAAREFPGAVENAVDGIVGRLASIGARAGAALANGIRSAINTVISAWNGLEFPGLKVKGKTVVPSIGTPNLPMFARGGIALGPSIFGEAGPEAAVPLGKSRQARRDRARVMAEAGLDGGGGGASTNIYIQSLTGYDPRIGRVVADTLNRANATGGNMDRLYSGVVAGP